MTWSMPCFSTVCFLSSPCRPRSDHTTTRSGPAKKWEWVHLQSTKIRPITATPRWRHSTTPHHRTTRKGATKNGIQSISNRTPNKNEINQQSPPPISPNHTQNWKSRPKSIKQPKIKTQIDKTNHPQQRGVFCLLAAGWGHATQRTSYQQHKNGIKPLNQ